MYRNNQPPMPPCGRPPQHSVHFGEINYTAEQINALLGMIPYKADRAEVPQMEKLSDVNYLGHVADASMLTDQTQPSWALVGNIKSAKPYFFYVDSFVPQGYTAGWNDVSGALGTYDLTADKVSVYDWNLLTEYNVSHNHTHDTMLFSKDWAVTSKYYTEFPDYIPGTTYCACSKVNVPGYTEHSFYANRKTSEAPFTVEVGTNEFTWKEANALVPEQYRFAGVRMTFINNMTRLAETWYFKGGTWQNEGNWTKINFETGEDQITAEELWKDKLMLPELTAQRAIADEFGNRIPDTYVQRNTVYEYIKSIYQELFIANPPALPNGYITMEMFSESVKDMLVSGEVTVENYPDEEDLTKKNGVLKFKDKEYAPSGYSGMGRIYLRKNLVNGLNVLTQNMMQKENTNYIIQYDYDLQGVEITVPANCVLDFQGGSLSNGGIKGNNTIINNNAIFRNINVIGTWNCPYISDTMFFYEENNVENNTQILTNLFSLSSNLIENTIFISRSYKYLPLYNSGLPVNSNTIITGNGEIYAEPIPYNYSQIIRVESVENVIIENLKLVGDVRTHLGTTGEWNYGIYLKGSKNIIVRNCDISEFWGDGINVQKSQYLTEESANEVDYEYHCHNVLIENCTVSKNRRNNISIEAAIGVVVNNCKCVDAGTINGTSPRMGIDIEPIPDNNQIVKNVIVSNCCFEGNIGKDIAVPASMVEGYLNINNCDLNSLEVWGSSSNIDICIENSKVKAEGSINIQTAGNLYINNNHVNPALVVLSKEVIINNSNFTSLSIGSTHKGSISNSNFTQIAMQSSSNLVFNNCFVAQIYVHRNISDITFKNCNIVGSSIIMFNSNVEVSNIVCENCNFENNNEGGNPFVGEDYISSNCLMRKCTIDIAYSGEIWLPFDNYISCDISADKIKALHDNALFENCNITTSNPITLLDISNRNDVKYIFKNTYIYAPGQLLTKSSGTKATYVKVFGGNINRSQESSALFIYFTEDSVVNSSNLTKNYTFTNSVTLANEDDTRYGCLRLPKISKGSIYITKYPSARYQSEIITEDIKISIYGNNYKCSIKTVGNLISVDDYSKLTYPKVYTDDNYMYIIFLCINGVKNDPIIKADIYSDSVIDSTFIIITKLTKEASLTNITTYIEDCIADTTSALKAIPVIEGVILQNGYSTDENKPIWWTDSKWVDAAGTEV